MDNLISILMPVFRAERYIEHAIYSILNQTYKNFELIIIYERQNDPTLKLIDKYNDVRIKKHFFQKTQRGISEQLNYGIGIAKGNIIARMDADDIAMPDKIQKQLDYLTTNTEIGIIGTNAYFINENGEIIFEKKFPQYHKSIEFMMPVINSILHPSILVYKKIIRDAGWYVSPTAEDHDLYLRLLLNGIKFYNIQEPLLKYRIIEKDNEFYEFQTKYFYDSSEIYLKKYYENKNSRHYKGEFILRIGLLEYYWGSINKSRNYLFKSFFLIPSRTLIIFRYFIFTLLGNSLFKYIRKKKIPQSINSFFINKLGLDSYNIKA